MKTLKSGILSLSWVLGLLVAAAAQPASPPPNQPEPAKEQAAPAPNPPGPAQDEGAPAKDEAMPPPDQAAPPAAEPPEAATPAEATPAEAAPVELVADGEKGLRLNFRGAPLEQVLNYLSEAAGFIIVPEVDVKGKVDVWSNQPLTKDEAVEVLDAVLNKNGFAALRNGRTLTIVSRDDAKKRDIPVRTGSDPAAIAKSDEIVTQIIPVRFISAVPLVRDLQQLLPTSATVSANEGGNSLIITDTMTNIRRMAEIIKALDTAISSISSVRVFPLRYADAKALATVLTQLFQPQQDTSRGGAQGMGRIFNMFRGGGTGGQGGPGGGGGDLGLSAGGGRAPTPRVVAVAEERSNSIIVSAPEEQMPIIADLIEKVDTNVEDVTELRVFRLKYADPQDTADLLTSLFPDTSTTQGGGMRGQVQFGGRFGGPFGGGPGMGRMGGTASTQSDRLLKQSKVIAVPDLRTSSVIVSAARELLDQIQKMIEELDSDPAKQQKVFVYSVENSDPQAVQDVLQNLFPSQYYGGSGGYGYNRRSSQQMGGQVGARRNTQQNQGFGQGGFGQGGFGQGAFGGSSGFGGSSIGGSGGRTGR